MHSLNQRRSGMTLLELVIALAVLAVMTTAVTLNLDRQARYLGSSSTRANLNLNTDILLDRITDRLEFARWAPSETVLTGGIGAGSGAVRVDNLNGFPPSGTLLIDPGSVGVERILYTSQDAGLSELNGLSRGILCTTAGGFPSGTIAQWEGVARVIDDQVAPTAAEFNGISAELRGNLFYLGDGTGFSYQVPVRAGAGGSMFDVDGEMLWGASIGGVELLTGFFALEFVATRAVLEANLALDLNADGDQVDVMDVGHIQLRVWDAANPVASDQTSVLSPSMIIQERCVYGGDLDNDGFNDPIFLMEPATGRLRVRLFSILETSTGTTVQRDETAILLDNSTQG